MPLTAGTRLGPYEIVAPLGAGGMGEVYKARDTRLDRAVALKVIQASVAADPEMRERFEREARAISALDHPHICMLYDVSRETPVGGRPPAAVGATAPPESVSFLVMQFLEGETLADRLARAGKPLSDPSRPSSGADSALSTTSRGPIPFETALRYAAEISQALDAAHRRGIVHRDLKPGNVMLTRTGTKLLDFGLAKLSAPSDGVAFGDGATRTSPLTSQGAILGTLYYMSPEQLEGRPVDARSDIFAFGAVLFEMLSGRRAFDGQSQAGIIAAIIGADPPTLSTLADVRTTLPTAAHRALDRLLRKCLAKDPEERWQSAADLADELQWINEERQRAVTDPSTAPARMDVTADSRSRWRERMWMAISGAALVALAGLAVWWYPRAAPPAAPVAFTIAPPPGQALANGPGLLSVSPDGRRVAFVTGGGDTGQLWVRTLASLTSERFDRATGAWHTFWSPDGQSIAFAGSGGTTGLRRIDLTGGAPMTLAAEADGRGAWSRDGIILFKAKGKLFRVSQAGGEAVPAMDLDESRQESSLDWPMFLPDGRRYLFLARSLDPSKHAIFLASLDAPGRTHLVNALSNVDYATGHLFYQRDGTLMAHPFDAAAGRLTGEAIPVAENVRYNAGNGRGAFSVSPSGVLAYVEGDDTSDASGRKLMLFDRAGKPLRQVGAPGPYSGAVLSPDGQQIVVTQDSGPQSRSRTLWLVDVARGVPTRFTVGDVEEFSPVWAPDGSSIAFASSRDNALGVYRRHAGGGATSDELLFSSPEQVMPTGFSPDGQLLLMTRGVGGAQRIWVLPLSGDRKPVQVFQGATTAQGHAVFSPDGKWIAYTSGGSATESEVYIQSFPADERRVRISTSSGRHPRWTADGRHIVYRTSTDALTAVELTPEGGTLRPSTPATLFTQPRQARFNWSFSTDPRAERFLLVVPAEQGVAEPAPAVITVIVNWAANISRK